MVKVIGPTMSFGGWQPLRKERKVYPPEPPPPVPEHVLVTAGDPAADPDCTGTYNYFDDFGGEHAYQRTIEPYYYLWWNIGADSWYISKALDSYPDNIYWNNYLTINGTYSPGMAATGYPVVSEVIPATP